MLAGILSATVLGRGPDRPAGRVAVASDARVELMSIIFRLAGSPEYNQESASSPYADRVDEHFGEFRGHRVVTLAAQLRAQRGISYDAVMSMAMHLTNPEDLDLRLGLDPRPERLDARWTPEDATRFVAAARDFVRVTSFNAFVNENRRFYDAASARLRDRIESRAYIAWFDEFFGARPGARFRAIPGLLNGGGNYGVGIRFPDGREEITPVIGAGRFDDEGLPVFGTNVVPTIVHEFCHSYTNPIVDAFLDDLAPAGRAIYPTVAAKMKRQAYGNWETMMYESLVRACTVRHVLSHDGPEEAQQEAARHHRRGFRWTGDLARLLGEYESDREHYPGLDDFMPRVVAFFDGYAAALETQAADAPTVIWMNPANGADDVDPDLTAITITFDRPMADGGWSVVGGGPNFPEVTGPPSYDRTHRIFTLPVRLEAGWNYRFSVNSDRFDAFRSAAGVPVAPLEVTFATRAR